MQVSSAPQSVVGHFSPVQIKPETNKRVPNKSCRRLILVVVLPGVVLNPASWSKDFNRVICYLAPPTKESLGAGAASLQTPLLFGAGRFWCLVLRFETAIQKRSKKVGVLHSPASCSLSLKELYVPCTLPRCYYSHCLPELGIVRPYLGLSCVEATCLCLFFFCGGGGLKG